MELTPSISLEEAQACWDTVYGLEGMRKEEFLKRRAFYHTTAIQLAEHLSRGENTVCTLGTGGGKTIIVLYVFPLLGSRTLMLAPTKALVAQHAKFYRENMGGRLPTRTITGETRTRDRLWNNRQERCVFATPGVVESEYRRGNFSFEDFDLIILDEVHNTRGEHVYGMIGDRAWQFGKPILGITASVGKNREKVIALCRRLHIFTTVRTEIRRPHLRMSAMFIPMGEALSQLESQEIVPLHDAIRAELVRILLCVSIQPPRQGKGVIRSTELERISRSIERLSEEDEESKKKKGRCLYALTKYKMFEHAYRTLMREGYSPFLEYAKRLGTDERKSGQALSRDMRLRRIVAFAKEHEAEHPKLIAFVRFVHSEVKWGRRVIAFFATKSSARFIKGVLEKCNIPCGLAFGGSGKKRDTEERIQELREGKILVLLATSVLQEGISVPEVKKVLHYSIPDEWIARLQRDGRTARSVPGETVAFVLEHLYDRRMHFSVQASLRKQEREEHERRRHVAGELSYQQFSLF